jgi:hypothetical protein
MLCITRSRSAHHQPHKSACCECSMYILFGTFTFEHRHGYAFVIVEYVQLVVRMPETNHLRALDFRRFLLLAIQGFSLTQNPLKPEPISASTPSIASNIFSYVSSQSLVALCNLLSLSKIEFKYFLPGRIFANRSYTRSQTRQLFGSISDENFRRVARIFLYYYVSSSSSR